MFWTIQRSLAATIGANKATIVAVAISSLLFGFAHAGTSSFSIAPLLILTFNGAVLALTVLRTGRLGYAIGIHAAWNFSQSKIFGFPMSGNPPSGALINWHGSGPAWWTGGSYAPEGGASGFLALLLIAGVAMWLTCREPMSQNT